jgi:hypothetical protein
MTHSEQIEELLYEAHASGMREEVLLLAKQLMTYSNMKPLKAYEQAFNQLITAKSEQDNH